MLTKFIGRLIIFLLPFYATGAVAIAVDQEDPELSEQREHYHQAMSALAERSFREFDNLKHGLRDYPLYPYLVYGEYSVLLHKASNDDIRKFLDRYEQTPLAERLRVQWLRRLQDGDRWRDFLEFYNPGIQSTEMACYHKRALHRSGAKEEAVKGALQLWQVGKSQPKACDPLFELLIKQNLITEDVAWKRYSLAVLNHQYQLASYLERFFKTPAYQQLARDFISIDRNSRVVGDYDLFAKHTPEVLSVIEHGISHLARTNAELALKHWNRYRQSHSFDSAAQGRILAQLVKSLYAQGHEKTADRYLLETLDLASVELLEWRLRVAIGGGNWSEVDRWLTHLPADARNSSRWQYWQARSLALQAGDPQAFETVHDRVHSTYQKLADERSYYGFLASEWLDLTHQMQHEPAAVSDEQIDGMARGAAFQRIRELLFHGDLLAARREWQQATRQFSEQDWLVAANLARRWQWHHKAIMSMVRAGYWNDIEIRFPLPYSPVFEENAEKNQIPLNLLFALSRQESAFWTDATSTAGARGLMQLMPATAKQTARKNGIPYNSIRDLEEPAINVRIGASYYRELLDRFDNNRILATAAYNAGPHRVDRWLRETGGRLPFDAWVETIPFLETRNYVQNVLAFSAIYSHQLGRENPMLSEQERLARL